MLSLISAKWSQIKKDSCQYCPKPHFLGCFQTFGGQCIFCFFSGILGETSKTRWHSELNRLQSCERANSELWGDIMWTLLAKKTNSSQLAPQSFASPLQSVLGSETWVLFASLHRLVGVDWLLLSVSPSSSSTCGEWWRVVEWSLPVFCLDIWRGFLCCSCCCLSLFLNPVAN